ncbi:uncharacterized protein [Branchiostoma lanceolatum]|uniref:uncharacterized protein n=1 Tax=Branchiostoma lanceolatum TaxID=7740 RepID=UPI0034514881
MSGAMPLDTSPSTTDQLAQVFFVPSTSNGLSGIDNSASQGPQERAARMLGQQEDTLASESSGGGNSVLLTASDILQSLSFVPDAQRESQGEKDLSITSGETNTDASNPHGEQDTVEITAKSIVILTPKGQGQISFSDSRLAHSQPAKELMVQGVPLNMQPIAATSVPCTTMATLPPGSIIVTLPHEMGNQNGICNVKVPVAGEKSILGKEKHKRNDGVVCDVCSAGFTTKNNLLRHQQLHKADTEEDSRPACELCGRRFNQISDLKRHLHTHTGTEPYRCQLCGRGFLRRSDLSTHLRFHNKVKPFQCALCDKTYYQSGDLKRHIRRSHEQTKDLACPLCEKMCATERSLRTHLRAQHNSVLMPQHTGQLRAAEGRGQSSVTSVKQQAGECV